MQKQKINCCADIFIFPVTENKVECITKNFKANSHQIVMKFQKM